MDRSVMDSVYAKIRTPYKYGSVLKFEDFYGDCRLDRIGGK